MFRKLAAECFGTFWLVFGGCGSAVLAAGFPELGIGFAGVALAFGLTVLTMAFAVGHISVVILTRGHYWFMGWRTFSGKRSRWLRNCPGCRRYCCSGAAVFNCQW